MRAWRRAVNQMLCGADEGCVIKAHDLYLELSGENWRKVRCPKHAGESVPAVIAEDQQPRPRTPLSFSSTRELAATATIGPKLLKFDHKAAQAGRDA